MSFQSALKITLGFEGGYSNQKIDPGGATNKGITQAVYDVYRKGRGFEQQTVKNISDSEVEQIYMNQYWVPGNCALLHPPVGCFHFDTCVNLGLLQAGKLLQRAIEFNEKKVDGIVGENTLAWAEVIPSVKTVHSYSVLRLDFYNKLIFKTPLLETFRQGWIARVKKLEVEVFKI